MSDTPDEHLSEGEIAHILGGLVEGEKDPDGAKRLLMEALRRIRCNEALRGLAEYLALAEKKLNAHDDANKAFGLTRPEHRPSRHQERDQNIAFLVQRELGTGKYDGEEHAALAVRDRLADRDPPVKLSDRTILNIYRQRKDNPIVQAASRFSTR